ncbi:Uncharacterized protein Adt_40558 [Abeliophyllum distichum]|uniref:Uncharacterized protein n=1 Tax=Abeliophyllum distichum TaxID=126358 RepID=A0ABD1Q8D9_9LAMI
MRELESRLVRVINGRCDHIETKLYRLLKLVESGASQPQGGEFQSDKSGFQSETRRFNTYSPHHEDNIPEENKGGEEDCVFEAVVENSVNVEDCTYEVQGEWRRGSTGQGMLSNPSTAIVVYQEMPRILIPDSKHRLGEHEPVDVVMSNQPEQSAENCPKVGAGDQENQDNVKFTPNSFFNSGSELETFSDQELQQFMTTRDTFNPNTFDAVPMYYFVVGCCCSKFVGLVSIY